MVFNKLFCVLLKKMKIKWNGNWINERNGNILKMKQNKIKKFKGIECLGRGPLMAGGLTAKE